MRRRLGLLLQARPQRINYPVLYMITRSKTRSAKKANPPWPKLVWHYTSFDGLRGILSGKIWASSVAYLSDTKEFGYGIDVAFAEFQDQINKNTRGWGWTEAKRRLRRYRQVTELRTTVNRQFTGVRGSDVYVAAFSTKNDDLNQWRAYGRTGPSFAVGFHAAKLATRAAEFGFDFERVRYGREQVGRDLTRMLSPWVRAILDTRRRKPSQRQLHDTKRRIA